MLVLLCRFVAFPFIRCIIPFILQKMPNQVGSAENETTNESSNKKTYKIILLVMVLVLIIVFVALVVLVLLSTSTSSSSFVTSSMSPTPSSYLDIGSTPNRSLSTSSMFTILSSTSKGSLSSSTISSSSLSLSSSASTISLSTLSTSTSTLTSTSTSTSSILSTSSPKHCEEGYTGVNCDQCTLSFHMENSACLGKFLSNVLPLKCITFLILYHSWSL